MSDRSVTVTIKYGKSYEETWAVFKGSVADVRDMIVEYFGVDPQTITELSTHELVINMTNVAHGTGNAAAMLGAVAIPASAQTVVNNGGNPWAGLDETPPANWPLAENPTVAERPFENVHKLIAEALDVPALQRVWAENQPAFKDPDITAAYKARGKELSK